MANDPILANKISTTISLVLAVYGNFKYALGRSPVEKDPEEDPFFRVGFTPFTGNILVILIYWGFLHLHQILFLSKYYWVDASQPPALSDSSNATAGAVQQKKVSDYVGVHFTLFNVFQFVWILLFSHGHYILAELVVIANFFNIVFLYFTQKTYTNANIIDYVLIHLTTSALPLSWLLYALFWNGAVVVGTNGLVARIFANIFIWDFLLVPGFYLVVYRDWGVGLSSAVLTLALGIGQIFTKLFALQWIFAFIISGLLLLSSIAVFSANLSNKRAGAAVDDENTPLIH